MAKTLSTFPAHHSAETRYPWDEYLNGEAWELVVGEDFTSKPSTFLQNARRHAENRGGRLRTRHLRDDGPERVVIQFRR